ncbi:hypothetical protein EUX98_g5048 [Antrodiella citrinella]|uniref:C3H1-type domain-containing protein n=1 Tax=Antrodiella citrinella TaxID=2447956 RepID=A0A4S4MTF7_9APHY|nr:hypothetical protein EUX98_g5048 [Antrodiella citrinella]
MCRNFALGHCSYGAKCAYVHVLQGYPSTSPPNVLVSDVYPPQPYPLSVQAGPVASPSVAEVFPDIFRGEATASVPEADESPSPPAPPCTPVCTPGSLPLMQNVVTPTLPISPAQVSDDSQARRPRRRVRAATTSGTNHYRTKPCKFFFSPGGCIKGDKCNFVHDPAIPWTPESGRSNRAMSLTSSSCPSESSLQYMKKEYYPINWRVIGGGVMMSGRRDICQDFIRGSCSDGPDYDEARSEDLHTAKFVPETTPVGFAYYDAVNPVSPLYLSTPRTASSFGIISPLLPTFEQQMKRSQHCLVVDPPPPDFEYTIHRVLDGHTLCERQLPVSEEPPLDSLPSDDPHDVDDVQTLSVPVQGSDGNLFTARSIVRPLSTPPAASGTIAVQRQLFAAESP